jgi:hypothetical protein
MVGWDQPESPTKILTSQDMKENEEKSALYSGLEASRISPWSMSKPWSFISLELFLLFCFILLHGNIAHLTGNANVYSSPNTHGNIQT